MDNQVGRGTLGDFVKEAQKGRAREDSTSKSSKIASVVHDAAEEEVRVVLAAGIVAARRGGIQHDMMVNQKQKYVVVFIVLAVKRFEGTGKSCREREISQTIWSLDGV